MSLFIFKNYGKEVSLSIGDKIRIVKKRREIEEYDTLVITDIIKQDNNQDYILCVKSSMYGNYQIYISNFSFDNYLIEKIE